jgi:hypothetical protein
MLTDSKKMSQRDALAYIFADRKRRLETLLEVEDKSRKLVPFKLNHIQDNMLTRSTGRDVYVKPAQIGATTLWAGDFLLDNITINGTTSVIVSYDEFSAGRLLLKAKKFYGSLQRRIPTIPKLDHKSVTELSFEDKKTNFYSSFYVFSAKSYVVGRGEPIHNLLLDEFAFYPEDTPELIFASAVKRVPLVKGTKIVIQSTANGEDNPFHELYVSAKERAAVQKVIFTPHFYEWYLHDEYEMKEDDDFVLPGDDCFPLKNISSEEAILLKRFELLGISDHKAHSKIRWRRYSIEEMKSLSRKGENIKSFQQECPEDDISCFISTGTSAYDTNIIQEKIRNCYPAIEHKNLVNSKGVSASVDIWHPPEQGTGYVIGCDPGKAKTSESVAHVWTFRDGYQDKEGKTVDPVFLHCATLVGWYDEAEFGEYCKLLGYFYNEAVLAPEDNLDLVSHVRDYPQLYYRDDLRNGSATRSIGWQTNVSTKPYMISEVNRNLEYLDCRDQRFFEQMKNVHRDAGVKSGISVVGAEDHHMAGGISIVCRSAMPVQRGYVGNSGDAGGWDDSWGR